MNDLFTTIDFLGIAGESMLHDFARSHRGTAYADIRFEVVFSRAASAENGAARESLESESASFGVSVQFAGHGGIFGNGQSGATIGRLAIKQAKLTFALKAALEEAYERARRSSREKAAMMRTLGAKATGLQDWPHPPARLGSSAFGVCPGRKPEAAADAHSEGEGSGAVTRRGWRIEDGRYNGIRHVRRFKPPGLCARRNGLGGRSGWRVGASQR
jgi:hypothetical protein